RKARSKKEPTISSKQHALFLPSTDYGHPQRLFKSNRQRRLAFPRWRWGSHSAEPVNYFPFLGVSGSSLNSPWEFLPLIVPRTVPSWSASMPSPGSLPMNLEALPPLSPCGNNLIVIGGTTLPSLLLASFVFRVSSLHSTATGVFSSLPRISTVASFLA